MLSPLFADNSAGWAFGGLMCFCGVVALFVYFAPTVLACYRNHPNSVPIIVVNLFLGWLLVGWVVALAWACTAIDRPDEPRRRQRRDDRDDDNPEYLDPRPPRT